MNVIFFNALECALSKFNLLFVIYDRNVCLITVVWIDCSEN